MSHSSDLQLEFIVHATGKQEVPPVNNKASGTLTLKFAEDFSKASYCLNVCPSKKITQAHLHLAAAGQNGPVEVFLLNNGGTAASPPAPGFTGKKGGVIKASNLISLGTVAALYDQIRKGNVYLNVHSTNFPAGIVRGQIFAN